jgi:hypothetical protein
MERVPPTVEAAGRSLRPGAARDAIAFLKADHKQILDWFSQFRKSRDGERRANLASNICRALRLHLRLEEEILYPAFLVATREREKHHEAHVEHAVARTLIAEIEAASSRDDYFDARVNVLGDMIRHHFRQEERPGGLFSDARRSDLDLEDLGRRLRARKEQLEHGADGSGRWATAATQLYA